MHFFLLLFAVSSCCSRVQSQLALPITNCIDLQNINNNLQQNYTLMNDIDCSSIDSFIPIGGGNYPAPRFVGNFDGQNFTIANLSIDRPYTAAVGLFGGIGDQTGQSQPLIQNLNFINARVNGNDNVGILAGFAYTGKFQNIQIQNSSVTGNANWIGGLIGIINNNMGAPSSVQNISINNISVQGRSYGGGGAVGGLLGYAAWTTIYKCNVSGVVKGTDSLSGIGGLVGLLDRAHISSCFTNTEVYGLSSVGGFIGYSWGYRILSSGSNGSVQGNFSVGGFIGTGRACEVVQSYSHAKVTGTESVGGFWGAAEYETVINQVYASGAVNVATIEGVGGLIGKYDQESPIKIIASYWDQEATGQQKSGGLGGVGVTTTQQMYQQSTYVGWDFDSNTPSWYIENGKSYPWPRLQDPPKF